ncbi:MAG: leucyl/phenylalanyl-tRNA--protein transferase [Zoogloea sp.]|uniref:leucyl/phenylalanyl-tRNA--protein transferase n=1 Tax=Zoogloea sp. TaxID=49181 RepID=UPI002607F8CE|nr:leucyl/phenylalanyl-tRNA--protein transferase [Zoogloea sp.]MDD3329006.1 leucyl/phenylalanyl-tRNA--protein transferase [Zoogloea sp.]
MIPWLDEAHGPAFPPTSRATRRPNGLLAAGGALTPDWLLAAYRRGIFPWFNDGEPILWWSPDPRMVVFPDQVRITRSLRKTLRNSAYEVRLDHDFAAVIRACAEPRDPGGGTWITPAIQAAYLRMHELGYAHCVETWIDGELAGGLYGIAIGRAFYGESMFSRRTDASKIAFAHLTRFLLQHDFRVLDCQMTTQHLNSLGGREIPREAFVRMLGELTREDRPPARWPQDGAQAPWT